MTVLGEARIDIVGTSLIVSGMEGQGKEEEKLHFPKFEATSMMKDQSDF